MIDLRNKPDAHPHQNRYTTVGMSMFMREQSLTRCKNMFDPLGETQVIDNNCNRKISE